MSHTGYSLVVLVFLALEGCCSHILTQKIGTAAVYSSGATHSNTKREPTSSFS